MVNEMHRWTSKQYQNLGKFSNRRICSKWKKNPQNIRIKEQKKEKLYRPESTYTENTLKNQCEIGPKTYCGKEREVERERERKSHDLVICSRFANACMTLQVS